MTSPKTDAALAEIKAAVEMGQSAIVPAYFSLFFGTPATSAAFRMAKASGLIVVAYISHSGTPVYRGA